MRNFLIVSKVDRLAEYKRISDEYSVSFEINDFFVPSILDNERKQEELIQMYLNAGLPKDSTMHGAFLDVAIFSEDKKICEVSQLRMQQSMQIARRLGVKGIVFHTNYNPYLSNQAYKDHLMETTSEYLSKLLKEYSDIEIYVENMFDTEPDILEGISKSLSKYKNYGVCLDWAHVNAYGCLYKNGKCVQNCSEWPRNKLQTEWISRLNPYVKHIHINDNNFDSDLHLPLGDGKIDWKQFFEYYHTYLKNSSILIETNEPDGQRKSLQYIRENFGLI